MKIIQINITNNIGSTGKIMNDLDNVINEYGYQGYKICAYSTVYQEKNLYCTNKGKYIYPLRKDILISRLTGIMGHRYKKTTQKLVKWVDELSPDIIHLHNIHGDWLNLEVLFDYIRKNKIPVIWTLHDCWAFTGRCSHFEMCGCEKWKTGCYACNNKNVYPITYLFDFSKELWEEKKKMFENLDLHIVVPSNWLGNYVAESFFKEYPITVINNGINTDIYHHSNIRSKYISGCDKKIILGVANSWTARKGFDDFIQLSKKLDSNIYQIVMVGLNSKQLNQIPNNVIGIERTDNQEELVELYSSADVYINPTYQDNYPTTNLEAMACGTLTLTYKTGGSPESIISSEYVFEQGDIEGLYNSIISVCEKKPYTSEFLQSYSKNKFDKKVAFLKYINLYNKVMKGRV